jgi:hypothetical protein
MQRGSSKHGPRLDDELEEETEDLTRSGQPPRAEEWRETEPTEGGHLEVPADHQPGTPPGMTAGDVNRRSDIARYLPARAFPADRASMLAYLRRTETPDEVYDAVRRLPPRRQFRSIGDVVRALGIATET